jgi:hypothetical protein
MRQIKGTSSALLGFILFFTSIFTVEKALARSLAIPFSEEEALIALYNSTDGENWNDNTGWLTSADPCDWYGVNCAGGHVTDINLGNNDLQGSIPADIGDLPYLETFTCQGNQLTGSIPPEMGNLQALEYIYMKNNQLTGLSPQLGNLSNLEWVFLSNNQIGDIPSTFGNLTDLRLLDLSDNQIISIPPELGNLESLEYLYLENNQLGELPSELGNMSALINLWISHNQISGTIPASIGNIDSLQELKASNNQLVGNIPSSFGNLSSLEELDLSNNHLSGTIPPEFESLSRLERLRLDHNQLSGSLPSGLGSLSNLCQLRLEANAFSGEIPNSIKDLLRLKECSAVNSSKADFGYNKLFSSDPSVLSFMNDIDTDWLETQTLIPKNIQTTVMSLTSVQLSWVPIPYTADGGYYEIGYAGKAGGPYIVHGRTSDKNASRYVIDSLSSYTDYHFVIRTYTPAHGSQQNALLTSYSQEVVDTPRFFDDVPLTHWAFDWIEAIAHAGITSGYPDGMYRPGNPVTRAEMAVFLLNGMGITPPATDGSHPFSDIAGHWAEPWMEELYDGGVTSGYPDGTYRPQNEVTRAEMAVFLLRAKHGAGYRPPAAVGGAFSDIAGHWAEDWIEQLAEEGITAGYTDGTYRPNNPVTRAEMAVFLTRTFDLFKP